MIAFVLLCSHACMCFDKLVVYFCDFYYLFIGFGKFLPKQKSDGQAENTKTPKVENKTQQKTEGM